MIETHTLECLDFFRVRDLVASYARTELGRGLAENIHPVTREPLIRRWFAQLEELQRLTEQRGLPPFGGLSDVRPLVKRCAPPLQVSVEEIARIGDALAATHALTVYFADLPESFPEIRHLAERIGDFGPIAERIRRVIDERGHARDDASPKLARIRADIRQAGTRIRAVVDRLLHDQDTRRLLQFPNYTFHDDRLVFPVRAEYRGRLPGIIHRSSDTGATIYVEPSQAVELNNEISNLRAAELEEINRLMWELAHGIYINVEAVQHTLDALAVLDLLVAKQRFAQEFEMRIPELESEPRMNVRDARHPLLIDLVRRKQAAGQTPKPVVPISFRLGDDFDLLIITGPNTGGKTVTLKTIGLLTLMVQAGLPVPVDRGSRFGIFKQLMIDIGDEQNMQQSLSTFSAHLKQQMYMIQKAGPQGLALIDELGAGTDPDEGAAIGRAILDELLRVGCRSIATTHIGALKSFPLTRPRAENGCVEFDAETLEPTFHLRIGEAGMSNAIDIAQRLGMPRRLIAAARGNLSRKARELRAVIEGASGAKRDAEEARRAAETARLDAARAHSEANDMRADLEKQKADFAEWVQRVVHLQPGDPVRVINFDRNGKVVRLRLDQQRAEIDLGSFAVEVPLGDLLPPETPPPPPPPPKPRPVVAPPPPKPRKPQKPVQPKAGPRPPRPEHGSRPREHQPPPQRAYHPLSEAEIKALSAGDEIVVKRLHRLGRIVRVEVAKQVAVVSVGLFEVEVPFNGMAIPDANFKEGFHGGPHRSDRPHGKPQRKGGKPHRDDRRGGRAKPSKEQSAAPAPSESTPAESDAPDAGSSSDETGGTM